MMQEAETEATGITALCPYWARFFSAGDRWIAYCSAQACEQMDKDRPGWQDYGEMPRAEVCQIPEYAEEPEIEWTTPYVVASVAGVGLEGGPIDQLASARWLDHFSRSTLRATPVIPPAEMTDALWGLCCEALLTFEPSPEVTP